MITNKKCCTFEQSKLYMLAFVFYNSETLAFSKITFQKSTKHGYLSISSFLFSRRNGLVIVCASMLLHNKEIKSTFCITVVSLSTLNSEMSMLLKEYGISTYSVITRKLLKAVIKSCF